MCRSFFSTQRFVVPEVFDSGLLPGEKSRPSRGSYDPIFVAIIELDERQITMALLAATFKLEADRDINWQDTENK